jgi:hypothetical protein
MTNYEKVKGTLTKWRGYQRIGRSPESDEFDAALAALEAMRKDGERLDAIERMGIDVEPPKPAACWRAGNYYAATLRSAIDGATEGDAASETKVQPEGRSDAHRLPTTAEMTGSDPNFTGDESTDDYIRRIRGRSDAPAPFQNRVDAWLLACFGEKIARDKAERNHRFLEEALELVQSLGCTVGEAHQLVDYVFGRPSGVPSQECGGVMVTLAALCTGHGLGMEGCAETELTRIHGKIEQIRAKQAAKPKHSPLPAEQQRVGASATNSEAPVPSEVAGPFYNEVNELGANAPPGVAGLPQRITTHSSDPGATHDLEHGGYYKPVCSSCLHTPHLPGCDQARVVEQPGGGRCDYCPHIWHHGRCLGVLIGGGNPDNLPGLACNCDGDLNAASTGPGAYAFLDGRGARIYHKLLIDNPYSPKSQEAVDWEDGWKLKHHEMMRKPSVPAGHRATSECLCRKALEEAVGCFRIWLKPLVRDPDADYSLMIKASRTATEMLLARFNAVLSAPCPLEAERGAWSRKPPTSASES